jgi:hypothetical protein
LPVAGTAIAWVFTRAAVAFDARFRPYLPSPVGE